MIHLILSGQFAVFVVEFCFVSERWGEESVQIDKPSTLVLLMIIMILIMIIIMIMINDDHRCLVGASSGSGIIDTAREDKTGAWSFSFDPQTDLLGKRRKANQD